MVVSMTISPSLPAISGRQLVQRGIDGVLHAGVAAHDLPLGEAHLGDGCGLGLGSGVTNPASTILASTIWPRSRARLGFQAGE